MSVHRSRFVTACQQLLALGVVLAALAPAARIVSLDVVAVPSGPFRATAEHGARGGVPASVRPSVRQQLRHPLGRGDLVAPFW